MKWFRIRDAQTSSPSGAESLSRRHLKTTLRPSYNVLILFLVTSLAHGLSFPRTEPLSSAEVATTKTVAEAFTTFDGYVRFSPLVGGPRFLPLHVELMLQNAQCRVEDTRTSIDSGLANLSPPQTISSVPATKMLHRFDFLPENPSDPNTLFRLLTLRTVPGMVRYRKKDVVAGGMSQLDARGFTVFRQLLFSEQNDLVISVGRLPLTCDIAGFEGIGIDSEVATAVRFSEQYQDRQGELHLLRNNCLTFALELLGHLRTESQGEHGAETWN